ncbi:hypothetical protein JD974_04215 [Chromobacterium haemolyticum]|uniref:Uncharacterized protein n=1 Tax=Chromobacterium haemolyticum TaxID=394935 RepID=A0ABS3GI33_9NEIS|nr:MULTISPECIES: hypothetical protein [Chromobacterium]MBK0413605.1 hypothetical protein [Chromobacterium haemolyticum]MBO0414707.1 hypothetical protein [Chromobacterium haemolyticum]MBO0497968.1 hypothetical protein [Chromobacterium haemolyticum]
MSALTNVFDWPKTTLLNVFNEAVNAEDDQFEVVEMELNNSRTFAIVMISGYHTQAVLQAMRDAQED